MKQTSYSSVLVSPSRHPFLSGLASIGSTRRWSSKYRRYLRGSALDDMRRDWMAVGADMRGAMSQIEL